MLKNLRLAPLAPLALTLVGACSSGPSADTTGSTESSTDTGGAGTPPSTSSANAASASSAASGSTSAGGGASTLWKPAPGTSWQWQITETVDTSLDVVMYDVDLFDAVPTPRSYQVPGFGTVMVPAGENPGIIDTLHAQGRVVICYMDSGAFESYRPDAALFPKSVIGAQTYAETGDPWEGEHWLDIRKSSWPKFEPLIAARMDLAKSLGCDGIEPDQNNPIGNDPGFAITIADQKAWYLRVAELAHARGLSVGQKNGIETTDADTVAAFDWNLNEECNQFSECDALEGFIEAGKAVFQVEYDDEGASVASFCSKDNQRNFDGLLKHLSLNAWRVACR